MHSRVTSLCRAWGDVDACNAECMQKHMNNSTNIALIPGGFQEATLYQRGKYRVFLKERKGFIKVLFLVLIDCLCLISSLLLLYVL